MKILYNNELEKLKYEDEVEHCFTDASLLHMGGCDLFAKALHDIHGYEMCRIDYPCSFHMFCRTVKNGKVIYIDVSGMSESIRDLQPGNDIEDEKIYSVSDVSIYGIHRSKNDDEYNENSEDQIIGYDFARRLIINHPEYYDVNYYEG